MIDESPLSGHISKRFDAELEDIRNRVLTMGGLVENQVNNGIRALVESDSAIAKIVSEMDYQVNSLQVDIDESCVEILARRQPAASDLRLVVAIIKTINDLERIGDQAEKLGQIGLKLAGDGSVKSQYDKLDHLGNLVSKMLHDALDSFARMNAKDALTTMRLDGKVDIEFESISRQLITFMMEDNRNIKNALRVSWCARALERIGDHAVNICEHVIYLVQGRDVRHVQYEELKPEEK